MDSPRTPYRKINFRLSDNAGAIRGFASHDPFIDALGRRSELWATFGCLVALAATSVLPEELDGNEDSPFGRTEVFEDGMPEE